MSLKTPYKLCDYKVAYGFIFEEELKGYDYWGFCDTDVLLGDIYQFLEEHSFFENDYSRYGLLGHLQIFKNSQEVNHIFMSGQGLNYRLDFHNIFTSEQNFIFDEADGIQKIFEKIISNNCKISFLMILILVISPLENMVKMNLNAIIFGQRKMVWNQ
ncbi:DUF6625 family protein [Streptococcus sp. HSISS3]|uniref:DUF6625 family protein n=1 Tax=Streptococcus sp. HSISS3 TaxID=1316412 RepID=UPI00349F8DC7